MFSSLFLLHELHCDVCEMHLKYNIQADTFCCHISGVIKNNILRQMQTIIAQATIIDACAAYCSFRK